MVKNWWNYLLEFWHSADKAYDYNKQGSLFQSCEIYGPVSESMLGGGGSYGDGEYALFLLKSVYYLKFSTLTKT